MSELTKIRFELETVDETGKMIPLSTIKDTVFQNDDALHLLFDLITLSKPKVFESICYRVKSIRHNEYGERLATIGFVTDRDDEAFNAFFAEYIKSCVVLCENFEKMRQTMSFEEAKKKFVESTVVLRGHLFAHPTENNITKFVQFVCSSINELEDFNLVVLFEQLTQHLSRVLNPNFETFTMLSGLRVHVTKTKDIGDLWVYRFLLIYSGPAYIYTAIHDHFTEYFKALQEGIMNREIKGHVL